MLLIEVKRRTRVYVAITITTIITAWYFVLIKRIHSIENKLLEKIAPSNIIAPTIISKRNEESSGRHQLPESNSTGICSCGGWQKWYYKGESAPSCCRRQTAMTVLNLVDFFESKNISYSPNGGGLVSTVRCGSLNRYDFDFDIYNSSQAKLQPLMEEWVQNENRAGGLLTKWGVTVGGLKWISNGWGDFNRRTPRGDVHLDFGVLNTDPPPFRPCSFYGRIITCRMMLLSCSLKSLERIGWLPDAGAVGTISGFAIRETN